MHLKRIALAGALAASLLAVNTAQAGSIIGLVDGKAIVDGALKFKDGDVNAGKTPNVIAGAYSNSFKGTKATALYDIDASGALLSQAPPNDGVLNTIGSLGIKLDGATAFNIVAQGE